MRKLVATAMTVLALAACGSLGTGITVGRDGLPEVIKALGEPAMRWTEADGSRRLAYAGGYFSPQNLMVTLDPAGRVKQVYNALDPANVGAIKPGMSKDDVLRHLGPPVPQQTLYFPARDELAWEWRYMEFGQIGRFSVLFDATQGVVRSTVVTFDYFPDPN